MKKICTVLLVAILLVLACCACNSSGTKENAACYLLMQSNSAPTYAADNIPEAAELKWWDGNDFQSDTAKKEATVEFGGKTYTGSYRYSSYGRYNSYAKDYYEDDDGVEFAINANNGKLVLIDLRTVSFFDTEPLLTDKHGIEDESAKIAKEVAAQFVDISDYKVSLEVTPYQPDEAQDPPMSIYEYTYTKTVNGENSTALITVYVTSKGNAAFVAVGDIDAFNGNVQKQAKAYKDIDEDGLALGAMKEISKDLISPSYEIKEKTYAVTPDGELVMVVRAGGDYYEHTEGEFADVPTGMEYIFIIK